MVASLPVGPGDLLELQVICRLQRSVSLETMTALEVGLYSIICHWGPPQTQSSNLQKFPDVDSATLDVSKCVAMLV